MNIALWTLQVLVALTFVAAGSAKLLGSPDMIALFGAVGVGQSLRYVTGSFEAEADAEFVLGSAAPHAHDLVLGRYSVHTSVATLQAGELRISEIQDRLQNEGRL